MESLIGVALFLLGATSASFMGLVAARLYTGEPIAKGRSKCDVCGKTLSVASLVPVLSHVFSRGRARCCGSRLSPVSPASELLLGLLFVLVYLHLGLSPALPGFLIALSALTGLVLYDFAHQILPPVLLSVFVGASAATGLVAYPDFAAVVAPSAILVGGILLLIHLLSAGRAMGFSDAPLAFGLALLTGPVALSGFIYSFWIGAVIGIGVLLRRPAGSRMGIEVPFAPFLAAGFILAYLTQWNLFTPDVLFAVFG